MKLNKKINQNSPLSAPMEISPDQISALKLAIKNNTYWDKIPVGSSQFMIKRIDDMDKLLDAVSDTAFNRDEQLPYWADLWPSSIALAHFINARREDFAGKSILEIGCGLGLAGIVATACGAKVLFTDYDPFALEFTQINFRRNFRRAGSVQPMDWRQPECAQRFDVILAADVLYEKRWLVAVLDVIEQCLLPGGTVVIAEPNRNVAAAFFKLIDSKKWKRETLLKPIRVNDKLHTVTIHRIITC
jgi:predicted nicotinamide N-methyase